MKFSFVAIKEDELGAEKSTQIPQKLRNVEEEGTKQRRNSYFVKTDVDENIRREEKSFKKSSKEACDLRVEAADETQEKKHKKTKYVVTRNVRTLLKDCKENADPDTKIHRRSELGAGKRQTR